MVENFKAENFLAIKAIEASLILQGAAKSVFYAIPTLITH